MILITYGTRPEYLKVKCLIKELEKENISFYTLFTGQHKNMKLINADFNIDMNYLISENRLDNIIGNILKDGDNIFNNKLKQIKYVLVQGDTSSVLGVALSAFHNNKIVIHLEAGLRTYNKKNPFPEETNRRMVSSIADIHLCPTELSKKNLLIEKTEGDIYVVGNTILDSLVKYKSKSKYNNKILITLHRRENHYIIGEWFNELNNLAKTYKDYEFILPLHPNPNVQKHKDLLKNIKIIDPLSHDELINILIKSKLIITDSGGIQEESSFFNKKCLVLRKYTERPEALNKSSFLVKNPSELNLMFKTHINDYKINYISPFGRGDSSKQIVNILKNKYEIR